MSVEFHITRAEFWAENEDAQITADEWLNYINNDNELSRYIINGDYHQTNRKTDTEKTLKPWSVLADHYRHS